MADKQRSVRRHKETRIEREKGQKSNQILRKEKAN